MNAFIRLLYSLLIAVATVVFVGFGIYAFYEPPAYPEYTSNYPTTYLSPGDEGYEKQQEEIQQIQDQDNKTYEDYEDSQRDYYRNVSFILLPLTALLTVGGVLFLKKFDVVGEGIALGGVATSIYAITVAARSDENMLLFASVTLFLLSAIFITHRRFQPEKKKK